MGLLKSLLKYKGAEKSVEKLGKNVAEKVAEEVGEQGAKTVSKIGEQERIAKKIQEHFGDKEATNIKELLKPIKNTKFENTANKLFLENSNTVERLKTKENFLENIIREDYKKTYNNWVASNSKLHNWESQEVKEKISASMYNAIKDTEKQRLAANFPNRASYTDQQREAIENRLKKLKKSYLEPKIPEIKSINNDKKNIASDFYNKHQDGIKTAVGLGVGGALMYSVFGNKGQQSNAQLYGQNQQY